MRMYVFHLNANFKENLNAYRMEKMLNNQVDKMTFLVYIGHLHYLICVGPFEFVGMI